MKAQLDINVLNMRCYKQADWKILEGTIFSRAHGEQCENKK